MIAETSAKNVSHHGQSALPPMESFIPPPCKNFLAFVDHMSCSVDTYVSLGGSNGCADQLTNWDGTQKIGLGYRPKGKFMAYHDKLCVN